MNTWDGLKLFYRSWNTVEPTQKAIVLFHGGHEHSGRFTPMIEMLGINNYMYFAWDARGHGMSEGRGDYTRSVQDLIRDANSFIEHILKKFSLSMSNIVLLGHSLGGLIVSSYVLDYKPDMRGVILSSPLFRVRTYVPFDRFIFRLLEHIKPSGYINSYMMASMLTHDKKEIEKRKEDPLITRPIGIKLLLSSIEQGERLIKMAPEIKIPTLILAAGNDWVAYLSAEKEFFRRLGSKSKEMVVYPGFFHEVLHEKDKHLPFQKICSFLESFYEGS